jgi:hypothetical protein
MENWAARTWQDYNKIQSQVSNFQITIGACLFANNVLSKATGSVCSDRGSLDPQFPARGWLRQPPCFSRTQPARLTMDCCIYNYKQFPALFCDTRSECHFANIKANKIREYQRPSVIGCSVSVRSCCIGDKSIRWDMTLCAIIVQRFVNNRKLFQSFSRRGMFLLGDLEDS